MDNSQKAIPLLILAAVFWSTSGILIKIVSMPPLAIAGWRSLIAALVILVWCKKDVQISWNRDVVLGALFMGLFCICFVLSTKLSTAANAIVLQYSASAYVAILAPIMINEPTQKKDWMLLFVVIFGISLFFFDDLSVKGIWGIVIGIVGALFWALSNIYLRKSRNRSTAWPLALGNFIAAGLCLPFMFSQAPGLTDALGILGLGVISIGAGYAVYAYAIKHARALEAMLICSVEPLINPLWVFLFAGELPGPAALTGCGLVLTAITARSLSSVLSSRTRLKRFKKTIPKAFNASESY